MSLADLKKTAIPVAKDENGDPQLICLVDGKVPVTETDPGTCYPTPFACILLTKTAEVPDKVLIGEVTINAEKTYKCTGWDISTNIDAIITIERIDDADGTPVPTVVHQFLMGPSHIKDCCKIDCLGFNTTGGTGTQKFTVSATAVSPDCLGAVMGFAYTGEIA